MAVYCLALPSESPGLICALSLFRHPFVLIRVYICLDVCLPQEKSHTYYAAAKHDNYLKIPCRVVMHSIHLSQDFRLLAGRFV